MKKTAAKAPTNSARFIKDVLKGGITVTIGGVPIQISLGPVPLRTESVAHTDRTAAGPAPKTRRKPRRRRSRRALLPDSRDVRGFLATRMEGATLTAVAGQFRVKRPLMKKMLARLLARSEVVIFKGAYYNNKRLRQRRIPSKMFATPSPPAPDRSEPAATAAAGAGQPEPVPLAAARAGTDPTSPV